LISTVVSIILAAHASGANLRVDGQAVSHDAIFHGRHMLAVGGKPPREIDGELSVKRESGGFRVVAHLSREEYVAAALESEAQEFQAPEALKAMAVAIRSYLASNPHRHGAGADLCDGTHCQRLRFPISQRMREAAEATRGEIVWYANKPAQVFYHQHCGGSTASAASVWGGQNLPYLVSRRDPYCERRAGSWRAEVSKASLERVLSSPAAHFGTNGSPVSLRVVGHNLSGRVSAVSMGTMSWSGSRFRDLLSGMTGEAGILSARFDIIESDDHFTFLGHGAGHGVGLCQHGTVARAEAGQNYRQILAAYFPGTRVGTE